MQKENAMLWEIPDWKKVMKMNLQSQSKAWKYLYDKS